MGDDSLARADLDAGGSALRSELPADGAGDELDDAAAGSVPRLRLEAGGVRAEIGARVIVHPLSRRKRDEIVRPAFLADEGHALDERGRRHPLSKLPPELRVFAQWETVDRFARDGIGELVAWGDEPIRWRHERRGDSHRRRGDVVIVKVPTDGGFEGGVVAWADWLRRHDVSPSWSMGSSSMSLLRSTLERELVTTNGELPEPRWTLGGRQQAWPEPGTEHAGLVQLDLEAAYPKTIGGLRYGGVWRAIDAPAMGRLDRLDDSGLPILAHALVDLRDDGLTLGPLPRRPRRRPEQGFDELSPNIPYPVAGRLSGLFSYAELRAARDAGARARIDRAYIHTCGSDVFAPWLDAILEGRELDGYARQLAKSTGSALWGQFVIDDRKMLAVLRWDSGRYSRLPVQGSKGHALRAWDVGELVCGSVRAELFRTLERFPRPQLVAAHTDGAWLHDSPLVEQELPKLEERGWRVKRRAAALRLLDAQKYAYRVPRGRSWHYVISGVPPARAAETFERLWQRFTTEEGRAA